MSQILITPHELETVYRQSNTVVFDCRYVLTDKAAGEQQYRNGHIPGAVYADLEKHLSGPVTSTSGRHPLPDHGHFKQFLRAAGMNHDSIAVVYDAVSGPFAARLYWMLRRAGINRARYLDGGYKAWTAAGYPVETAVPQPNPGNIEPATDGVPLKITADIRKNLSTKAYTVVDAREPVRFSGQTEPLDPVAGHIPGAKNRNFADNLTAEGVFKMPNEIAQGFETAGMNNPAQIIHSCGSGVTACHNFLAMEIAGLTGSAVYAGSWSEWCADPNNPVETGLPDGTPI